MHKTLFLCFMCWSGISVVDVLEWENIVDVLERESIVDVLERENIVDVLEREIVVGIRDGVIPVCCRGNRDVLWWDVIL
ncbi:hypothetical protein [Escherichia coli]|uniref:hypothetical protein n=1 Tax=Escherichia coli TaxID=562 RepID=UPI000E1C4396|nr:hypothetical protein [Escherichia coli]RDT14130.1 hypothetical protein DXF84_10710 [Escherichia coli]